MKGFGWTEQIPTTFYNLRKELFGGDKIDDKTDFVRGIVVKWLSDKIEVNGTVIDKCMYLLDINNIREYVFVNRPDWLKYVPYFAVEFYYSYTFKGLDILLSGYDIDSYTFSSMMYDLGAFVEHSINSNFVADERLKRLGTMTLSFENSLTHYIVQYFREGDGEEFVIQCLETWLDTPEEPVVLEKPDFEVIKMRLKERKRIK